MATVFSDGSPLAKTLFFLAIIQFALGIPVLIAGVFVPDSDLAVYLKSFDRPLDNGQPVNGKWINHPFHVIFDFVLFIIPMFAGAVALAVGLYGAFATFILKRVPIAAYGAAGVTLIVFYLVCFLVPVMGLAILTKTCLGDTGGICYMCEDTDRVEQCAQNEGITLNQGKCLQQNCDSIQDANSCSGSCEGVSGGQADGFLRCDANVATWCSQQAGTGCDYRRTEIQPLCDGFYSLNYVMVIFIFLSLAFMAVTGIVACIVCMQLKKEDEVVMSVVVTDQSGRQTEAYRGGAVSGLEVSVPTEDTGSY